MGSIKGVKYKSNTAAKKVLLYVQHRKRERNVNEVINIDDIDDVAEMKGADILELFEI